MSAAPRASKRRRARRVFDRAIALAWCRWEILRRTSRYRAEVRSLVEETSRIVQSRIVQWAPSRYEERCLADGGVVDRVFDNVVANHYDEICARYGLTVVMHPEASLSDDEMAAFPVFADTPRRQLTVRDHALLRRVVRRGGDVNPRMQRRIFGKAFVDCGPYQPAMPRLHVDRVAMMLAVFDAHSSGSSFAAIARHEQLSVDQAKRAWRRARTVIDNWFDIEPHLSACPDCLACVNGRRERYCRAFELQIGRQTSRGVRTRATDSTQLDILAARRSEALPARRSLRLPDSRAG